MKIRITFILILSFVINTLQAQLVNFEETWQEFLNDNKISNVSKLPKPAKELTGDYLKYNLMYANSNFCQGSFANAKSYMRKIQELGETEYASIPGFKDKHNDLELKMDAYLKADKLWKKFLSTKSVSLEELAEADDAIRVCEKGTLAKFSYMQAYTHYCNGDVKKSQDRFENYTLKIVDKTSLKIEDVKGLKPEVETMRKVFKALKVLDKSWANYMETDVSEGFEEDLPEMECYSIPSMKAYVLIAAKDICKNGARMLKKIQALQATNTHELGEDLATKIEWLEKEVATYTGDLATLNKAWKEFMPSDNLVELIDFELQYCNKEAQIRSHLMDGTINICTRGKLMLEKVAEVQSEHNPKLQKSTLDKIENLKSKVNTADDNLKVLNKAWVEFLEKDTLDKIDFVYKYCDKAEQIKAYTINGLVNICSEGSSMVAKIDAIQTAFDVSLTDELTEKVELLKLQAEQYATEAENLDNLWKMYIANKDTLTEEFEIAPFYCDKIHQVKSWVIKGNFESCENGQRYLDIIKTFKADNKLSFDTELACRVRRLQIKVWDCRWMELVVQARKETHEERERFGPKSAGVMFGDLNGPDLPCETTVSYYPLGNIGIKYIITVFLCQNIDLAKMGDPEYYQKISTWVDSEVLQTYCEANMRCKEDFFIYLEGHTDGNPFRGARYKKSLDIPQGTPFTHFVGDKVEEIATEREIKNSLKNNMELGIARAWTVKKQLDFMNVPISIGAYEHPKSERGGEYRRIAIELNITNLLLDYYEKRLNELWVASKIGDRPKTCK